MSESVTDTIAAIATAPGEGAIAVVRVSGPESLSIADRVFRGKGPPPSSRPGQSFLHGNIQGADGVADEVILLIYRSPHSYTREDAIEIQGHGGTAATRRILRSVLDAGARTAEPGEFTKRAFLNGRMDLLQAEAVLDLIRARSDRAADAALEQMQGNLSRSFDKLYGDLLELAADLETTLDFSEDELPDSVTRDIIARMKTVEAEFKQLLATWDEGHLLREGALVVIAGKPNVGKSTLLNALLGKERAIVTPIAGTTRDTIEEQMVICGYTVRLVDTAGIRDTSCEIEGEGVRRAKHIISHADLTLYVIDGSESFGEDDQDRINGLSKRNTIIVNNKADLQNKATNHPFASTSSVVTISALESQGIDALKDAIVKSLGIRESEPSGTAISERHRALLVSAHKDLVEASLLLSRATPEPALAASRLRQALLTLGEATGRVYHDELLNSIFSRFCIGK